MSLQSLQNEINSLKAERKENFQKMATNRKAQAEAQKFGKHDKVQELNSEYQSLKSEQLRIEKEIEKKENLQVLNAKKGGGGEAGAGIGRSRNQNQQTEDQDQKKSTTQDSNEKINSQQRKNLQEEINRRYAEAQKKNKGR